MANRHVQNDATKKGYSNIGKVPILFRGICPIIVIDPAHVFH